MLAEPKTPVQLDLRRAAAFDQWVRCSNCAAFVACCGWAPFRHLFAQLAAEGRQILRSAAGGERTFAGGAVARAHGGARSGPGAPRAGALQSEQRKYPPDGGRIEIEAQRQGDRVAIAVRDNSIGIEPDMLTPVFGISQAAPAQARA
jgi:hypothetical protein